MTKVASPNDRTSFILPSFGFKSRLTAEDFMLKPIPDSCVNDLSDRFDLFTRGEKFYAPRISSVGSHWLTGNVMGGGAGHSQIYDTLRAMHTAMPSDDAYNCVLMVDGPRQYSQYEANSTKHLMLWHDLSMGMRNCFAVWADCKGTICGGANALDGTNHVHVARNGHGVMYARTPVFDDVGAVVKYKHILLRLLFSVHDKNVGKDDILDVNMDKDVLHSNQNDSVEAFTNRLYRRDWRPLIDAARRGFDSHC